MLIINELTAQKKSEPSHFGKARFGLKTVFD